MLPQKFSFEIFQEEKNKELWVKLIHQLNKDFNQTGIEIFFDVNLSPKELANQLQKYLEVLLNNKFQSYLNLLYRIDVAEVKLKMIEDIEVHKISKKVTILILKREWQKVWFRNKNL